MCIFVFFRPLLQLMPLSTSNIFECQSIDLWYYFFYCIHYRAKSDNFFPMYICPMKMGWSGEIEWYFFPFLHFYWMRNHSYSQILQLDLYYSFLYFSNEFNLMIASQLWISICHFHYFFLKQSVYKVLFHFWCLQSSFLPKQHTFKRICVMFLFINLCFDEIGTLLGSFTQRKAWIGNKWKHILW